MYEILKQINEMTYLASKDDELYIIKQIFPEDVDVYRLLINEHNPNLAEIVDVMCFEGKLCAVRNYIQGVNLDVYIEKNGPLSEKMTRKTALDICNGLKSLHSKGIIHRDISPGNIIIDSEGKAVIIDFGISRMHKPSQTKDTQILGTQGFAAPEQFGFSQTGVRSDIYSLGVLMNYMITGVLLNEKQAYGRIGTIIRRCTEMDEKKRYSDIKMLESALSKKMIVSNLLYGVPGFRSGKISVSILSAFAYIFSGCSAYAAGAARNDIAGYMVLWIFGIILPVFILFDVKYWTKYFN